MRSMPASEAPSHPTARPDVALRHVGSEWVLFDAARERAHVLNQAAAVVWAHCDGRHDAAAMADAILHELPTADAAAVRRDVDEVLRRFAAEGLLR